MTVPDLLLKRKIGCKSYDARGIFTVVEKVVNKNPKNDTKIFVENGDDFNARVGSLLVGSNNRNKVNNTEVENVSNTLQRCVNFGIESVETKQFKNQQCNRQLSVHHSIAVKYAVVRYKTG